MVSERLIPSAVLYSDLSSIPEVQRNESWPNRKISPEEYPEHFRHKSYLAGLRSDLRSAAGLLLLDCSSTWVAAEEPCFGTGGASAAMVVVVGPNAAAAG